MKYHFIGDQGISMRGLKEYMRSLGHEVSGSDLKTGGHKAKNITSDIDVVVRTSAVSPGSPGWVEVEAAEKLSIKVLKRSELLGEITRGKKLLAVSGMHGKTTISALVGLLLVEAGFDPTVLVGEEVRDFKGVLRIGKSDWFVAEICEYDRSFLDIYPEILILTNIEEEHLDTYPGGLPEIKQAFIRYVSHVPGDGLIIACADDENVCDVVGRSSSRAKIINYGFSSDRYNKINFNIALTGWHNVQNALAILALADYLNVDKNIVQKVLTTFQGARRRFEFKGNFNGADIIDDYGHHPTEIKATISALVEKYSDKKKIVVFWPHQYKRIKPLLSKFAEAFNGVDKIILKPIFFVPGRDEVLNVESEDLAKLIGHKAQIMENDEEIIHYLTNSLDDNSVLLTIGIPPVYKIAEALINKNG